FGRAGRVHPAARGGARRPPRVPTRPPGGAAATEPDQPRRHHGPPPQPGSIVTATPSFPRTRITGGCASGAAARDVHDPRCAVALTAPPETAPHTRHVASAHRGGPRRRRQVPGDGQGGRRQQHARRQGRARLLATAHRGRRLARGPGAQVIRVPPRTRTQGGDPAFLRPPSDRALLPGVRVRDRPSCPRPVAGFLAAMDDRPLSKTRARSTRWPWICSSLISLTCMLVLVAVWWRVYSAPPPRYPGEIVLTTDEQARGFLRAHVPRPSAAEEAPMYIPTGVFIQSAQFKGPYTVLVAGYIWQRYQDGLPHDLERGVVLPEAEE